MWISKIVLRNIRSFENETVELSKSINIFVGPNNSGKSTIAYSLFHLQNNLNFITTEDFRVGSNQQNIEIYLQQKNHSPIPSNIEVISVNLAAGVLMGSPGNIQVVKIPNTEPLNFIYPYLSKRKVAGYAEQINIQSANTIMSNMQNLYAKVDKICNPQLPAYEKYVSACKNTLGFVVTSSSSPNGKKAGYAIDNFKSIAIDKMGEGVASILGLIVDLCVAENKLFIIEEPENDIHPKALKAVLNLIIDKSKNNQFVITTHSNIVTKYLGAEIGTKIIRVSTEFDKANIPTSKINEIPGTPEARSELLEELGYELSDVDMWAGWLFLEEASAEKIIKDYLICWFAPSLQGKLKTYSSKGKDQIKEKFNNFNTLFCYLNLQAIYKNKAWIILDAGNEEKKLINELKERYEIHGWTEDHFQQFKEHNFESYYPENFKDKVTEILNMPNGLKRQQAKINLLAEVESWIKNNEAQAKKDFTNSAADVIAKLKEIEKQINKGSD